MSRAYDAKPSTGLFPWSLFRTVNGSGAPTSWFFNVLAGDRVIGRQPSAGNRKYYHTDLLGSTRAVVEGAAVVESYDPEPWGLLMPGRTLGSGTKEGFTGKERDAESGLDYFGARLYMPALARWTSVDPLAEKHPEWSPYNYVLNNPLVLLDPDGLQVNATRGAGIDPTSRMPRIGPMRPMMWAGVAARGGAYMADRVAGFAPLSSTVQDATAVATGRDFTGAAVVGKDRIFALAGLLTPASGKQLKAADEIVGATVDALRPASKIGDDAAQGTVYIRTNPKSGEQYVGQAKSPERFDARQGEHDRALGVHHKYEVLGHAEPGEALDVLEETKIRQHGGLKKEGGTLANKKHQMREERYRKAGGAADNPKP